MAEAIVSFSQNLIEPMVIFPTPINPNPKGLELQNSEPMKPKNLKNSNSEVKNCCKWCNYLNLMNFHNLEQPEPKKYSKVETPLNPKSKSRIKVKTKPRKRGNSTPKNQC